MNKKIIKLAILLILLLSNVNHINADEKKGENSASGQVVITYTAVRKPSTEIDKGEGLQGSNTGDTTVAKQLKFMVVTSASLLMLIIFIRKGEKNYEKK